MRVKLSFKGTVGDFTEGVRSIGEIGAIMVEGLESILNGAALEGLESIPNGAALEGV